MSSIVASASRRSFAASFLACALVFVGCGTAEDPHVATSTSAITNGAPDAGAHPYVGVAQFYNADGTPAWWHCTGTLIAPTVFLTAGHCVGGLLGPAPASARVWFDEVVAEPFLTATGGVTGTPVVHPDFSFDCGAPRSHCPNTHDVGVIILDGEVTDRGFAELAPLHTLDGLARGGGHSNTTFDFVGYGIRDTHPVPVGNRARFTAQTHLINLNSALTDGFNVRISSNGGNWTEAAGGLCLFDSGGPLLLEGTNVVVAIGSFARNCFGTAHAYRMDIPDARDFLLALP